MPTTHPMTLTDHRRTLVMHVLEDPPGRYTWRIVVEEKCGGAECDSMIEAAADYPRTPKRKRPAGLPATACWTRRAPGEVTRGKRTDHIR
jgi:hypothetical protein